MDEQPAPTPNELERILADGSRYSLAIAVVIGIVAVIAGHWEIAYSAVLAAAVFMWSLRQQMRAFQHALARRIDAGDPTSKGASGQYGLAFLRILLLLLALGGILWYTPARPIGVVLGVGCVLVGLAVAALNSRAR